MDRLGWLILELMLAYGNRLGWLILGLILVVVMDMSGLKLGLMLGTGHGHIRLVDTWTGVRYWSWTC